MIKALAIAALILLSACTPTTAIQTTVVTPTKQPEKVIVEKRVEFDDTTWSLHLNDEWKVRQQVTVTKDATDAIAISRDRFGSAHAVLAIRVATLPDDLTEEFFGEELVRFIARHKPKTILGADIADVAGKRGTVAILSDSEAVVFQAAVGHRGKGHVIRCFGDATVAKELMKICSSAIEQFKLKEVIP